MKTGQDTQGRRLARAVGAQEADDLALLNVEADLVNRPNDSEPFGQVLDSYHRYDEPPNPVANPPSR